MAPHPYIDEQTFYNRDRIKNYTDPINERIQMRERNYPFLSREEMDGYAEDLDAMDNLNNARGSFYLDPNAKDSRDYLYDYGEMEDFYVDGISDDALADKMYRGEYGNMTDRKRRFMDEGYSADKYRQIQDLVNSKYYGRSSSASPRDMGGFQDGFRLHDIYGNAGYTSDNGEVIYYDDLGQVPEEANSLGGPRYVDVPEPAPMRPIQFTPRNVAMSPQEGADRAAAMRRRSHTYSLDGEYDSRGAVNADRINQERLLMDDYFDQKAAMKRDYRASKQGANRDERRRLRSEYLDARSAQRSRMRNNKQALNKRARDVKRDLRG